MAREDAEEWTTRVYESATSEELARAYDLWADRYDEDMHVLGRRGPEIVAALVARHVRDLGAAILDAGAGTGLVGQWLHSLGYTHLIALDLSKGMLEKAARRGIYRELHQGVLGDPLSFPPGAFDAVVAAGVFTKAHAPASAFDELLRITRSGGHVIVTVVADDEQGEFSRKFDACTAEGRWRLIDASKAIHALPASDAFRQLMFVTLVFQVS
jgi:SAM-dependent methyltransferase